MTLRRTREYEVAMILSPEATEAEAVEVVERITNFISEGGGSVSGQDNWGVRRLAYPIQRFVEGNYFIIRCTMEPQTAVELNNVLNSERGVVRYLVLRLDKSDIVAMENQAVAEQEAREREATEQETAEREARERDAAEQETAEREARERDAAEQEAAEREARERDAAEQEAAEREAREREATEQEVAEREVREREAEELEAADREAGERGATEREAKEREAAEQEAAEREAREREAREREAEELEAADREAREREAAEQEAAENEAGEQDATEREVREREDAERDPEDSFAMIFFQAMTPTPADAPDNPVIFSGGGPNTEESARRRTQQSSQFGRSGDYVRRQVTRWEPSDAAKELSDEFRSMVHGDYGKRCQVCGNTFTLPGGQLQVFVVHIVPPSEDARANNFGNLLGLCGWHYALIRYGEWAWLDSETGQPIREWERMRYSALAASENTDDVGNRYIAVRVCFSNVYQQWNPEPDTIDGEIRYSIPHWMFLRELLDA